jgi:hypothetical protein
MRLDLSEGRATHTTLDMNDLPASAFTGICSVEPSALIGFKEESVSPEAAKCQRGDLSFTTVSGLTTIGTELQNHLWFDHCYAFWIYLLVQ